MAPGSGGVLLHIGVHKTGTTALQAALAGARDDLAEAGILYPGQADSHHKAARAAMQRPWGWGQEAADVDPAPWAELLDEISPADRVVISSEFLGEGDDEQVQNVLRDLAPRPVTVLITLRPLLALTPSSYQQFLKYGMKHTYEHWLHRVLPYDGVARGPFWKRNDHGRVVERWARLAGATNVVIVVVDPQDRQLVFREVARLLDVDPALLLRHRKQVTNRSMTAAESAVLRELNVRYRGPRDWRWYDRHIRRGAARQMVEDRRPGPAEPMLVTPRWAADELLLVAADSMDRIRRSGVEVRGDIASLTAPAPQPDPVQVEVIPLDAAVAAVTGLARSIPDVRRRTPRAPEPRSRWRRLRDRARRR